MGHKGQGIVLIVALLALCGCEGTKSYTVLPMKDGDKQLNCAQLELEINEAEFYRKAAMDNQGFTFSSLLSPFSYPSTAMSANNAIASANERVNYLRQIHAIKRCDNPEVRNAELRQPAQPPAYAAPPRITAAAMPPHYPAHTFNPPAQMQPMPPVPASAPPSWPQQPPAHGLSAPPPMQQQPATGYLRPPAPPPPPEATLHPAATPGPAAKEHSGYLEF